MSRLIRSALLAFVFPLVVPACSLRSGSDAPHGSASAGGPTASPSIAAPAWSRLRASQAALTETREPSEAAEGVVGVKDGALVDDRGPFWDIGATYMAAAWFYRHDRERLERSLELLSRSGVGYIRVLGEVGGEFWSGRETDPRWPDYDDMIAGLTDLAFAVHGLRVQWTIFGGTDFSRTPEARAALVDRFATMALARPQAIVLLEIANEGWQNGFEGDAGRTELLALTRRLQGRLRGGGARIPVAPTSPQGGDCESWLRMYRGSTADLATIHFSRTGSGAAGPWQAVIAPWAYRRCEGMPRVGVNNEPIGPESSVESEEDPTRLVTAAAVTFISGMPLHVFHSRAGVRGDIGFEELPNARETFAGFAALRATLPRATATGRAFDLRAPDHPIGLVSPSWAEDGPEGVVAGYGTLIGDDLYAILVGIKGKARLRSARMLDVEVIDPLTGKRTERLAVGPGGSFEVSQNGAAILRASARSGGNRASPP